MELDVQHLSESTHGSKIEITTAAKIMQRTRRVFGAGRRRRIRRRDHHDGSATDVRPDQQPACAATKPATSIPGTPLPESVVNEHRRSKRPNHTLKSVGPAIRSPASRRQRLSRDLDRPRSRIATIPRPAACRMQCEHLNLAPRHAHGNVCPVPGATTQLCWVVLPPTGQPTLSKAAPGKAARCHDPTCWVVPEQPTPLNVSRRHKNAPRQDHTTIRSGMNQAGPHQ